MIEQPTTDASPKCRFCGGNHIITGNAICPHLAAIEYYPDGTVKRVEYRGPVPMQDIIWQSDESGDTWPMTARRQP